ncbi:hypothetical protein [Microbulbifer yueqingensis]|uniref:DUF4239 domain-containing protein n=1 Tax=Microbulbifer yueqingensis TaxID=658219 RepID=A0A1G9DC95_9GAMM|nr:hypothetical protein [Microbulbifer yueqingensis]SDK61536.1 hypothetical protein SAMN05216212_2731 [Microbulbifer yueqingensis]
MTFSEFFSTVPLLGMGAISILVVMVSLGLGTLLGRLTARGRDSRGDASMGSVVAATLGLLAFMLAFTFNMTAERFGQRKALLLEEVNAIATTYLRADFLDERGTVKARKLLAEYARVRDFDPRAGALEDYRRRLQRSEQIQRALWELVAQHEARGYEPERLRAFYQPLNEVLDYHTRRTLVGGEYRIPAPIWVALYAITALSMLAIGFQLGVSRGGSLLVALALAVAFSLVILLIADLDRSYEGFLLVDQAPMKELSEQLQQGERPPPAG